MIKLNVNGREHTIEAEADTPLLYVLRNELKLTGPRYGCGMAQCGACVVLLEGKEIRSCVTPVSLVAGKRLDTIEGLPALWAQKQGVDGAQADMTWHPIQQAWIDVQVPQCGYCQSGMMIAAADGSGKPFQVVESIGALD